MIMTDELVAAITEMREEDALAIAERMLDAGEEPRDVLDACRQAMDVIGKRFESGEYFIPELILAGEMLTQISDLAKPRMRQPEESAKLGKVIIGTVEGDIHDIAKDIVAFMLEINGFEVTNLGVDVPAARFVEAVKESDAKILALSGFLTLAYDPMKETVQALKAAGLDDVKVMIGGGQIDDQIRVYVGADAYGRDAMTAVALAKEWM
jgi:methanogenic corrinoid protein MtbC1